MTIKQNKIEKIFDLHEKDVSEKAIALTLGISDKSVRNKLKKRHSPSLTHLRSITPTYVPSGDKQWSLTPVKTDYPSYYDQPASPSYSMLLNENKRLMKENTTLNRGLWQMIGERDEAKAQLQSRTTALEQKNQEKEDMKQMVMQLTDEKDILSEKVQDLIRTVEQQNKVTNIMKKEIETHKHELTLKNQQFNQMERENREKEQKSNENLTKAHGVNDLLSKKIDTITQEYDNMKQELHRQNEAQSNSWMKYGFFAVIGAGLGILGYEKLQEITSKPAILKRAESVKNARYSADSKIKAREPILLIQPIQMSPPLSNTPLLKTNNDFLGGNQQNLRQDTLGSYLGIDIDYMTGFQFEIFWQQFFEQQAYQSQLTKKTHDQGGDLILRRLFEIIIVQLKRNQKKIGVKAIQEVYTAKGAYQATVARVITNNYFTKPALKLAKKLGVECWDRDRIRLELYKASVFLSSGIGSASSHPLLKREI